VCPGRASWEFNGLDQATVEGLGSGLIPVVWAPCKLSCLETVCVFGDGTCLEVGDVPQSLHYQPRLQFA